LRVEEVAEAVIIVPGCKAFDIDDRFFDPKDVLSICAGLIKRVQDTNDLVLAHYSVQEFLLSGRIIQSTASYFGLNHQTSQRRLAEACLTYLLSFEGKIAPYIGMEDDYPFLQYAAQHWLDHVAPGSTDYRSMLTSLVFNLMDRWQESGSFDWYAFLDPDLSYDFALYTQEVPSAVNLPRSSPVGLMCLWHRFDIALSFVEAGEPFHSHGPDCGALLKSAVKESSFPLLDRIIAAGCDLNVILPEGSTALCLAAWKGDVEMIQKMLSAGAEVNVSAQDATQGRYATETASHAAAKHHNIDVVKVLLAAGADVNAVEAYGGSVLNAFLGSEKFSMPASMEFAMILIDSGADVNAGTDTHCAPLNTLLSRLFPPTDISPQIAQTMLDCDVDLENLSGERGILLFNLAFTMKYKQAEEIATRPAKRHLHQRTVRSVLHTTEIKGPDVTAIVKLLLSAGADPNACGSLYPATVRARARKYCLLDKFNSFFKAGANLDLLGPDKGTSLQAACSLPFEATETVVALLEGGADPNRYDCQADSPLNMAIERGYKDIAKTLVEAGAKSLPGTQSKEVRQIMYSHKVFMEKFHIPSN
jgi:Ankyrin repeats (3 copies)